MRLPRQITARKAHFRSQSGARWIVRQRHMNGPGLLPKRPAAAPLSDRLSARSLHELGRIAEHTVGAEMPHATNPILSLPELAGLLFAPGLSNVHLMGVAGQPQRQGKGPRSRSSPWFNAAT